MSPWITAAVDEAEAAMKESDQRIATSKILMGKKYQTRDGRAVRILAIDRSLSRWPVVGLITNCAGNEVMQAWDSNGFQEYYEEVSLIPVPTKHDSWFVTSHVQAMAQFTTKEEAAQFAKRNGGTVAHCFWED